MAGAIRIVTVGRPERGPYADLIARYLERAGRFATVATASVSPSRARRAADRRREESAALAERAGGGGLLVALDRSGESVATERFAKLVTRGREASGITFVVGGPDGLDADLLRRAGATLALSRLTLPHDLALLVLVEQIYRVLAGAAGHPYAAH